MSSILFGLFGFSFFVSKSGFTVLYAIVVIYGLFKFPWNIIFQLPRLEKCMIALFPLAIFLNLFSTGGPHSALEVLMRWTWPLIYFPLFHLNANTKLRDLFLKGLGAGLFVACLYSYFRFYDEFQFVYDGKNRVASFWDILRWAYFCAVAVTVLLAMLMRKNFLDKNLSRMVKILFFMTLTCLVLSNSRGAWIGALIGIFCVLLFQKKSLKYFLIFGTLVLGVLLASSSIRNRILSSFQIQKKGDQITSENGSNASRLNMWKVGLDLYKEVPFFGIGFDNSKPALQEFFSRQDPAYVQTYTAFEYSYNDQHSSYMSLLLQFGGIYFIFIYGLFFVVTYKARKQEIYIPAMVCTYFVYFFYSGIVSFEAVVILGMISMMMFGLRKNENLIKE